MEELIGLVAVGGGLGLGAYIFWGIFSLIRTRINRNNIGEEAFNRLARAFAKHKKESEQRIQNLEAIVAGDESSEKAGPSNDRSPAIEAPTKSIEIEETEKVKKKKNSNPGNLRNMLRE